MTGSAPRTRRLTHGYLIIWTLQDCGPRGKARRKFGVIELHPTAGTGTPHSTSRGGGTGTMEGGEGWYLYTCLLCIYAHTS